MLTAEIRVDTTLIAYVHIVDEESHKMQNSLHRYEVYQPDIGTTPGNIRHDRKDGALALIRKVIDDAID